MMEAVPTYWFNLVDSEGRKISTRKMPEVKTEDKDWMIFVQPPPPKVKKQDDPVAIMARVIKHIEDADGGTSGPGQHVQLESGKQPDLNLAVPWEDWVQLDVTKAAGNTTQADVAAAVAVLQMLHSQIDHSAVPVKMMYNATKKDLRVVATQPIKKGELLLPPCTQKRRVLTNSTHPRRVEICATRTTASGAGSAAVAAPKAGGKAKKKKEGPAPQEGKEDKPEQVAQRPAAAVAAEKDRVVPASSITYYMHPEFKLPELDEDQGTWKFEDSTSLHPFWCIWRFGQDASKT